jgi:hypothetical protein
MLSFSISYQDLINFPCFGDLTLRRDRGWKKGGPKDRVKDRVTLRKTGMAL